MNFKWNITKNAMILNRISSGFSSEKNVKWKGVLSVLLAKESTHNFNLIIWAHWTMGVQHCVRSLIQEHYSVVVSYTTSAY